MPKLAARRGPRLHVHEAGAATPTDPWFLTALDFRTGATDLQALAGAGLGFNNNYAPVTIGPDGTVYVGVLGGLVSLRDATPHRVARAPTIKVAPARRRHR